MIKSQASFFPGPREKERERERRKKRECARAREGEGGADEAVLQDRRGEGRSTHAGRGMGGKCAHQERDRDLPLYLP